MSEGLNSVSSIGVLPFIEGCLRDCTSGLVASSRDSAVALVKSTLRVSLLKGATRTAVARMWLGDG